LRKPKACVWEWVIGSAQGRFAEYSWDPPGAQRPKPSGDVSLSP
jgi:hypothetical protein